MNNGHSTSMFLAQVHAIMFLSFLKSPLRFVFCCGLFIPFFKLPEVFTPKCASIGRSNYFITYLPKAIMSVIYVEFFIYKCSTFYQLYC